MHTHTNEGSEREQSTCTPHRRNEKEIYFIPTTQLLSNIASCPRMYLIANGRWMMTLRFQFSPLALSRSSSSISSISRSVDLAQIKPHTKRAETRQSQKSTNLSLMKYESWAIELWPRSRNWSVRWMAPRDQFQQTNCNIVMNFSFVIAIVCVCVYVWVSDCLWHSQCFCLRSFFYLFDSKNNKKLTIEPAGEGEHCWQPKIPTI